jgi:uncharacterized membrane protein
VRALGLIAAALHLVLCAVAAFLMFFVATFPFENQTREEAAADNWLIGAAAIMLLLAVVIGGAVIARRAGVGAIAMAVQLVGAGIVLATRFASRITVTAGFSATPW